MRKVLALAAATLPVLANAQSTPTSAQGDVSLTIYNNDLALVQDVRQMTLPTGRTRQEFGDVSAAIRPETVTLNAGGTGIVEQNFDYDLLTPEKLMDKAVGQTVTLVRTNPATGAETRETATILANNGGTVVRIGERIEVLNRSAARVVFPSLPAGLRARPTLSVTLDTTTPGARPVSLSYLSRGFGWKADYVALFDEAAGKIDVQAWITLNNRSGTTFNQAKVLLVAGAVGQGSQQVSRPQRPVMPGNRPGTQSANRESLGDFYVYPIAGRTTVANAQQKQVSFLDVAGAPATKAYHFRNGWLQNQTEPQSADAVLRFSTAREAGLGDALPAGTVRVYMRDARGQPQFIGENGIGHTPMGSALALKTGEAFDVKVQPMLEKRDRIDSGEWERTARYRVTTPGKAATEVTVETEKVFWRTTMTYKVTNAKATPVTVEVVQGGLDNWWHDTRVPSETIKGEQRSADERVWEVPVPANGETTLTVQFDSRY
ncbi:MAG: DUF4139 domain-containing protein [Novosphingobium sp. 17-62-19]|uniref:DUF4139 domain-containing protein n=1 Tax=Novosphingobium sp. 17-62-19 TaxID=1970406 RepID=UPI000BD404F4|nr:DUF4139 domain-containing protein [Novosphingobium sp. 17-62-19]OYX93258.1 MAG: DUF4139 domain-containing protein [Novosphingobium sp. 35-62-5]OZA16555.1 MAG: DUF4139 domain-containing protein [Novosphingobium sp. 17-62-19]